jgi:hypothetical protein
VSDIEPVHVHIASSDVQLPAAPRRKRRALKTNTFTLPNSAPVQVMRQSDNRAEGWITSATEASPPAIYIAASQADAASQSGGAAQIVGTDTAPFPVHTTDAVWLSAATGFPVTVSVVQIFEELE